MTSLRSVATKPTGVQEVFSLWRVKEDVWQELLSYTPHDPAFALCDSMPLPACRFARAYRCSRFRGEATFGKDTLLKQTFFYGFRVHYRGSLCWPGVISRLSLEPRPMPTNSRYSPSSSSSPPA